MKMYKMGSFRLRWKSSWSLVARTLQPSVCARIVNELPAGLNEDVSVVVRGNPVMEAASEITTPQSN